MAPAQFIIGQKHKKDDEASSRASWNTPRPTSRLGMTYGTRMAITFAMASLMTVLILIAVVSVVWGTAFSEYTRANMADIANITARKLAESYEQNENTWSTALLQSVAESGVGSDDIGMQVLDTHGNVLYDDTWPAAAIAKRIEREEKAASGETGGAGSQAIDAAQHSLVSTAPDDAEGAVSEAVTTSDGERIGTLRMWVLGSDVLLTKADTAFREKTINAMTLASLVAMVIALIIGFLVSRMLTNPIRRITGTAKQIRDGDLSARTGMKGDDEIDQLGETFDEMATSLERDLKHERRLTSDVAHELRTPLMAMLATVEAMQDGVYPTDSEHLETVASETRRLARLVQEMLDLSRNENRSNPLNIEQVDIVSLVRNTVDVQHPLFHERNVHLRFTAESQGRPIHAEVDADKITQAVVNLLSNAMRYTPEDGWVVASVKHDRQRREVLISVSDTGIGIAKEDLSRIFSRFWRADASRAREAGGLGVGLAVTQQIIERHHGYIAVESELDHGTTFTIHLPREHSARADKADRDRAQRAEKVELENLAQREAARRTAKEAGDPLEEDPAPAPAQPGPLVHRCRAGCRIR